jgi:ABC-type multidrug transport system ATPase subunit
MLSVNNISFKHGEKVVLKDVNREFTKGVYILHSPNGRGKTTFMKLLTTLLIPDEGEITYNGIEITDMGVEYRDILGYLPQEFGYYKNYSPEKFLLYISALKGISRKTSKKNIDNIIKKFNLSDVRNQKMKGISRGNIQKVGIGQAFLNDPEILILDEPTVKLDEKEITNFINIIESISNYKIIIISTHNLCEFENLKKEIIYIEEKKFVG